MEPQDPTPSAPAAPPVEAPIVADATPEVPAPPPGHIAWETVHGDGTIVRSFVPDPSLKPAPAK